MNIGNKIRNARKNKGITQEQLAKMMYKSKRTIEKYEANQIDISISTLNEIATILDINVSELIIDDSNDILNFLMNYYNLEDKPNHNIENDFEMIMKGFIERYKK